MELNKHIFRRKRVQPICLDFYNIWEQYERCQFLFKEGDLFGCKANGVHSSWATCISKGLPATHLASYNTLTRHRNYTINVCPFRLKIWIINIFSLLITIFKWLIDLLGKMLKK
jgi:hypothetical protein